MKENHAHFFGSLPKQFMWERIQEGHIPLGRYQELWNKFSPNIEYKKATFHDFSKMLSRAFGNNSQENVQNFFLLYSLLHYLLKSQDSAENTVFYREGAKAIAGEFFSQGIKSFTLLVGISNDPREVLSKLEHIRLGFEEIEKQYGDSRHGQVRLTITRRKDGSIKNTTPQNLEEALYFLDKNPQILSRLDGFDFSGEENPKFLEPTLALLSILLDHNKYRQKKQKKQHTISIHAGESCFDFSPEDNLYAFEKLLPLGWSNLSHGTFLWLPSQLLSLPKSDERDRQRLLLQCSDTRKILEICPTSNILLTPMGSFEDIPLRFFEDNSITYTINTDNPTLFSTTLAQERQKIGLR